MLLCRPRINITGRLARRKEDDRCRKRDPHDSESSLDRDMMPVRALFLKIAPMGIYEKIDDAQSGGKTYKYEYLQPTLEIPPRNSRNDLL